VQNIFRESDEYKKTIMLAGLFQACIIKRPFNLFHRNNLYIRNADVQRNFGNKATWDKDFHFYFEKFVGEVNEAVLDNQKENLALCKDVMDLDIDPDLVYFDPPYMNSKGVSVDYHAFYHFLEGLTIYRDWEKRIDFKSHNLHLKKKKNPWNSPHDIKRAFAKLFQKFRETILVVSYRGDGTPTIDELRSLILNSGKKKVEIKVFENYKYVLSHGRSEEVLLIGR
jgi:adenine-specific DNA-methyltransferase